MGAWFEDLPLDFSRAETRAAERIIVTGYSSNAEAIMLAEDAGLDTSLLNTHNPVRVLVRDMFQTARVADRLRTLLAAVLDDPSRAGLHDQLQVLVAGHAAAIRDPGIDSWGQADAEPTAGLERTINVMAGYVDPSEFRRLLAEAEVRTARVEIAGKARGTGFLIGPDLLMTNWHVVEHGVDGALARFDHSSRGAGRPVGFADDWLVAHSPHDSEDNELSPDGPPDGTWDFAIVRLAEPVGDQAIGPDPAAPDAVRGHYGLDWGPYEFEAAEPLLILGHPDGGVIQLSDASPAGARLTSKLNRVRYDTNTSGGSSGSPVFNRDFRIVALHNAGGKGAGPGLFNQGVPIAGIGTALRTQLDGRPELTAIGLT